MSFVYAKNRVQLYDFSAYKTKLKNSTRSGKQSSDEETNSEAYVSGYDLSISTSPVLFSQSPSRMHGNSSSNMLRGHQTRWPNDKMLVHPTCWVVQHLSFGRAFKACPNGKCFTVKHA